MFFFIARYCCFLLQMQFFPTNKYIYNAAVVTILNSMLENSFRTLKVQNKVECQKLLKTFLDYGRLFTLVIQFLNNFFVV